MTSTLPPWQPFVKPSFEQFMKKKSNLSGELQNFGTNLSEYFNELIRIGAEFIDATNIAPVIDKYAPEIFQEVVLPRIEKSFDENYAHFKKGEGEAFKFAATDFTIKILEGLSDFREYLDDKGLGKFVDLLLSAASLAIMAVVTYYCPILVPVIAATGILDKIQDFFKADNLKNTVEKMKEHREYAKDLESIGETATGLKKIFKHEEIPIEGKKEVIDSYIMLNDNSQKLANDIIKNTGEIVGSLDNIKPPSKLLAQSIKILEQDFLIGKELLTPESKRIKVILDRDLKKPLEKILESKQNIFDKIIAMQKLGENVSKDLVAQGSNATDIKSKIYQQLLGKNFDPEILVKVEQFKVLHKDNELFLKQLGYTGVAQSKPVSREANITGSTYTNSVGKNSKQLHQSWQQQVKEEKTASKEKGMSRKRS